jgi:hypothetical protein
MVGIRNKSNQRLTINLKSGTLELLARSTADVSEDDFSSTHLQNLLGSGKIILESQKKYKSKKKWTPKKVESSKEEVSESEEQTESVTLTEEIDQPEVPETEDKSEESQESGELESEAEPLIHE